MSPILSDAETLTRAQRKSSNAESVPRSTPDVRTFPSVLAIMLVNFGAKPIMTISTNEFAPTTRVGNANTECWSGT